MKPNKVPFYMELIKKYGENQKVKKFYPTIRKYFGFLIAGIPGSIVAFLLNILFVKYIYLNKSLSYAIVLLIQITINYFFLQIFVFKSQKNVPYFIQYLRFVGAIIIFRFFDWGLYTFLVEIINWNYLLVQLLNIVIFSFTKFIFSSRIFEPKKQKKTSSDY